MSDSPRSTTAHYFIRFANNQVSDDRASFQELRQFLPQRKAEAVLAALRISARSGQLDNPESIYQCEMLLVSDPFQAQRTRGPVSVAEQNDSDHFVMVRIHARQPVDSQGFTNKISARNEKFLASFLPILKRTKSEL